jgi:RHH-type proline utilization regulon transcriptional repressor/proline dehydrogenase/delta 1-pyrroline-5-carboxylate dehydrogenase
MDTDGAFLPADAEVERRTQALGRRLLERAQRRRTSWVDGAEDRVLVLLSENDRLRTRALRLVDVLPGLAPGRDDALLLELARELLGPLVGAGARAERGGRELPAAVALPLQAALSGALPAGVFAGLARGAVARIGRRFIVPAGEEGDVLRDLRAAGRLATFDVLGEAVVGERQAAAYAARYRDLVDALAGDADAGHDSPGGVRRLQVSLKLSALTPRFDPADPPGTLRRIREPLEAILDGARRAGVAVTWDVEQYALRDLTWWLFQEVFRPGGPFGDWDGAGIVAQAYLRDAPAFVAAAVAFARRRGVPFQVRLVKGAYWDYETVVAGANHWPAPVYAEKWRTDAGYEALTRTLLGAWPDVRAAVASHNVRSLVHAAAVAESLGLAPAAVEYQTLYGMDPAISGALPDMGWVARDYVPSGDLLGGMAYLVRRLLENTSQVGFLRQSRIDLDAGALLAPPAPPARDGPAPDAPPPGDPADAPPDAGSGFVPVAPLRLYLAPERERFAAALARTRHAWGQDVPLRIGGVAVETGAPPLVSLSPSRPDPDDPVARVWAADGAAAQRAIAVANAGAPPWAALPVRDRARRLRRAADLLLAAREEVAAWEVHEAGKDRAGALADVDEAIDYLRYYAAGAEQLPPGYRPRGVVAVIPPWNFPVAIPCGMAAAALVTGNAVILKSAEQTPLVAHLLVDALHRAGVPEDALIHLPGEGETVGQALVASPDVDMVAFTGSRDVGRHIVATAAAVRPTRGGFKHVLAEMGGKNPVLVFADADPEEAAAAVLTSAFGHAGQKCSAASRVLVQRPLYERLTALLVDGARSLPVGPADDPATAINPVISAGAGDGIRRWADVARREGRVLLDLLDAPGGAGRASEAGDGVPAGYLLGPLIVALEPETLSLEGILRARTFREEIFGPVLVVVPFETEDEALALANATDYGLTAGVFTRSPARARRVAGALRAGNVYVNREITGARVGVEPFGGVWLSGTGPQAGGREYLYAFVRRDAPAARAGRGADPLPPVLADAPPPAGAAPAGVSPWKADALTRAERIARVAVGLTDPALRAPALALVSRVSELVLDEPTLPVPGQHTVASWAAPRGAGLVVADATAAPADLVLYLAGALLAGNGVAVVTAPGHRALAADLVGRLTAGGVPDTALRLLEPGGADTGAGAGAGAWLEVALALAGGPIAFVAGVTAEAVRQRLAARLGQPWEGQRWIKALLTAEDGPAPDEAGFLRRFALPKTVAVRTLRHGADLGAGLGDD